MSEDKGKQSGLNILCIGGCRLGRPWLSQHRPSVDLINPDGGGVRGLSSLVLLSETMSRVQKLEGLDDPPGPHRYFDVIAGTGTGACVPRLLHSNIGFFIAEWISVHSIEACMLGRLQISVEQAIEFYGKLVKNVFSERKIFGSNGSAFKLSKLKKALMEIVGHATGNENELMMDKRADADSCKTYSYHFNSRV
jgi:hypothetical protein